MSFDLEQRLMQKLMQLDRAYYDRFKPDELTKHLGKGVGGTRQLLYALTTPSLITQVPLAIFATIYIGQYSLVVVAILILFMAGYIWAGIRLGKVTGQVEKKENELDTHIMSEREEVVYHMTFLQQQRATKSAYRRLRRQDEEQLQTTFILIKLYAWFNWLSGKVEFLVGLLTVLFFVPLVVSEAMPVGTFFALYLYIGFVVQPALHWGDIYAEIKSAWSKAEPLADFFDAEPHIVDLPDADELNPLATSVQFRNVSFAYRGREAYPVLHDVSFEIPKGKMTAIVGSSGGGKSTIAKLLLRQYDPSVGQVTWDGISLKDSTLDSIYRRVDYLPQDTPIFSGNVRLNVDLRQSHTTDEIVEALRLAHADFALTPEGLDRSAYSLSGGEKQRLALARMLLRNPDLVVLDEATSSLDQSTERGVVETLDELRRFQGLTQVVIAHRLSTVMHADQIVLMENGRVAAIGTHTELLQTSLVYQDLTKTFVSQD